MTITDPEKRILEAARKVFERDGFAGARMQVIADEAGISKASLHYYFRSKEKLFDRIFQEYMDRVMPIISTWDDDSDAWQPKVRVFVRDMMGLFRDTSLLFMVQELYRDPKKLEARLAAKRKEPNRFIKYSERLQASGLVRDMDPRVIAVTMHSMCAYPYMNAPMLCGALRMKTPEYDKFLESYIDEAAELLIRMMKK
jgi:TetR/AcrR family transcriptional regulator